MHSNIAMSACYDNSTRFFFLPHLLYLMQAHSFQCTLRLKTFLFFILSLYSECITKCFYVTQQESCCFVCICTFRKKIAQLCHSEHFLPFITLLNAKVKFLEYALFLVCYSAEESS